MKKILTITIICPVFNEQDNIIHFYDNFSNVINLIKKKYPKKYDFKFLFADNSSTDNTESIIKNLCKKDSKVMYMRYSRNFGYMKSIYTAFVSTSSDAATIFDCDLQDPPELLISFIDKWKLGYKTMYGTRISRDESWLMSFLRHRFRSFEYFIKGYKVEIETGVWFLDASVIKELKKLSFEPYLPGLISRLGFLSIGIPYDRRKRRFGKSKANYPHYFSYATDGLISGTILPLRITTIMGLIFALILIILMCYFIYVKLFTDIIFPTGIVALSVILLFAFSINFIFMGILGEYIGRIYMSNETSEIAIIEKKINLK